MSAIEGAASAPLECPGGRVAPARPRACFALGAPGPGAWQPPGARRAAAVAAMLRHAAIEAARADGRDPAWIRRYVAGHGESEVEKGERFSYLVLPPVLGAGGGAATRVLLAEPAGASGEGALWAERRLAGALLVPEDEPGRPAARLLPAAPDDPLLERALRAAQCWASVTPVVLPGHDDRRLAKAQALLRRALAQAGLPEPDRVRVELRSAPFWDAALEAREYAAPAHLHALPRFHVRIAFPAPVAGPLAIGAGRHAGLGLLAAWE